MLSNLFYVVIGGGLGAGLRFLAATVVIRFYSGIFPLATFLINVTGSFAIGILMTFFLNRPGLNPAWRLFFVTGILGGYTTFSSFEWETLTISRGGSPLMALANVVLSVVLGFLGVWTGYALISRLRPH